MRLAKLHKHCLRILVCSIALGSAKPTLAGGGVGATIGGATELTQIMNHFELLASVSQQSAMVTQNITAHITRVQQYMAMLQNLVQLPAHALEQIMAPWRDQLQMFMQLAHSVESLLEATHQTRALFKRSLREITQLHLTPEQWLAAHSNLARSRDHLYQRQWRQDLAALDTLAHRARSVHTLSSQIPGITSTIQGLQLLNQQASILASEMLELRALMQRQLTMQNKDQQAHEWSNRALLNLIQARQAQARQLDTHERQLIQNGPFHVLQEHP
ncbi:conjugal transfer protein TrbJ [Mycoavidus sp. B2-EB]|uniref:conjugal transfer protein TrbJ n=1 Tax=Mycoavidus sp. B2-EB TaxID=2651972 RepID=UPI0016278C6C|nr:conjugal transfer protein TrbJ [Mycoavidus sp. B2-EB]BBO59919.1 hypothetical protein MPB2EB_1049 [Mycoavidus sp. B2-EB]